jgi:hypothetical protein
VVPCAQEPPQRKVILLLQVCTYLVFGKWNFSVS